MTSLIKKFENNRKFTYLEANKLYKIIAFTEALGWTLLIAGIIIEHTSLPLHNDVLFIFGQIHGLIFITYFIVLMVIYPNLKWTRTIFVFSLISGVLPYGSLVLEIYLSTKSKHSEHNNELESKIKLFIVDDRYQLLAQPINRIDWEVPLLFDFINQVDANSLTSDLEKTVASFISKQLSKFNISSNILRIHKLYIDNHGLIIFEIRCRDLRANLLSDWNTLLINYDDFMLIAKKPNLGT